MEIASIAASLASLVLAIVAIALAVFFYTQSKNTETNVRSALEGIKVQTESLQKLTGRWMDRLTRYVTTRQEVNVPNSEQLLQAIKGLPTNIASELIKQPSPAAAVQELSALLANAYVALYYYIGVANVWSQMALPNIEDFDKTQDFSNLVKQVVDQSANDFVVLSQTLNKMGPDLIASLPAKGLFDEAVSRYRPLVADSTHVYARRAEMKEENESDPHDE